ncbi:UNVERIFIED_CONTAM: hypothetical protein O1L33_25280, partial [Pseudomonas aeruginosa]
MDFDGLDRQLRDSLADLKLSNEERDELRQLGGELAPDQVRFLRNRAFDLVRELVLMEEQGERIARISHSPAHWAVLTDAGRRRWRRLPTALISGKRLRARLNKAL